MLTLFGKSQTEMFVPLIAIMLQSFLEILLMFKKMIHLL